MFCPGRDEELLSSRGQLRIVSQSGGSTCKLHDPTHVCSDNAHVNSLRSPCIPTGRDVTK
jgi:hypothetical protein